jgi:hypothetical protein
VPDPSGSSAPTRTQVRGATTFDGGEGIWYHHGWAYFTTKGDNSVHGLDLRKGAYRLIWKGDPKGPAAGSGLLTGVDNITVDAGSGDLYVAEDGGNMELVLITPDGTASVFARLMGDGQDGSEITGPVQNPLRNRLYFSSQRGPSAKALGEMLPGIGLLPADARSGGITYEISGPFRGLTVAGARATTALANPDAGTPTVTRTGSGSNSGAAVTLGVGAAAAAAAVAGGALLLRRRRTTPRTAEPRPILTPVPVDPTALRASTVALAKAADDEAAAARLARANRAHEPDTDQPVADEPDATAEPDDPTESG